MTSLFYRLLMKLARWVGDWSFLMIAWFVATGYFLFFPRRVAVSWRFYRHLFPEHGHFAALRCAWRQYHRFVHLFLDRFRLARGEMIPVACQGWEHVVEAIQSRKGAILLMSHFGSWEIAATLLMRQAGMGETKLLLYLGEKHREAIEALQKESIMAQGIRIVAVPETGGSGMEVIEGLHFLREGGIVSLTGDRLWGQDPRSVTVRFAQGSARLPVTPYVLAMLSGAPMLVFFGYRLGKEGYQLMAKPLFNLSAAKREDREKVIQEAAQTYADWLAEMAHRHPEQWFHFTPFLDDPGQRRPGGDI